jgi:phenylacetate-coenzyme A ligase PaaK-like adenylate-forming protein
MQVARLQQTLQHVFDNSPPYREKFENAGVHPTDLKTLQDLKHFPFTTKQDLRAHYPFGLFSVPMDQVARLHASSGTTGKPTVVGYTKGDLDHWALYWRVGRTLRCRKVGLYRHPDVGWSNRKAGTASARLSSRHHYGYAVLHAQYCR